MHTMIYIHRAREEREGSSTEDASFCFVYSEGTGTVSLNYVGRKS